MSKVIFLKGNSSGLSSQPLTDGAIYFASDIGKLYIDAEASSGNVARYLVNKNQIFSDTKENWDANISFVGEKDCFYIYTNYRIREDGKVIPGIKIGDGNAYLIDAPFLDSEFLEHIENSTIHVSAEDRIKWDNKVSCYLDSLNEETVVFTVD